MCFESVQCHLPLARDRSPAIHAPAHQGMCANMGARITAVAIRLGPGVPGSVGVGTVEAMGWGAVGEASPAVADNFPTEEEFGEDRAAKAWNVPTNLWDSLPEEHKGRMWAVFRAELIMEAWESRQITRRLK